MEHKPNGRKPNHMHKMTGQVNVGSDYSDDEIEFMMAVDKFKRRTDIKFPTLAELLSIVKDLGYSKNGE